MAYRRFYYSLPEVELGTPIPLRGEVVHHLLDVCRFGVGDRFELLPGDGRAVLVEIVSVSSKEVVVSGLSTRPLPAPAKPALTLALSIPKLPKVDWIVEKCVELGVAEIRPFVSDYSFLRKVNEISPQRMKRWEKLIQAATQQTGRGDLMKLHPVTTLAELLEDFNRQTRTRGLFPYEGESQVGLTAALKDIVKAEPDAIWTFVGSEGGYSPREVQLFAEYDLKPVSMGSQILRVETACLALVSIIKYETGALC